MVMVTSLANVTHSRNTKIKPLQGYSLILFLLVCLTCWNSFCYSGRIHPQCPETYIGKNLKGTSVLETTYEGTTPEEQDASCCEKCFKSTSCEFWVRNKSGTCWLRKRFSGMEINASYRSAFGRKSGHRSGAAGKTVGLENGMLVFLYSRKLNKYLLSKKNQTTGGLTWSSTKSDVESDYGWFIEWTNFLNNRQVICFRSPCMFSS